jgi:protein-S-isoprenylcysteine O-methyltransferase Ste14
MGAESDVVLAAYLISAALLLAGAAVVFRVVVRRDYQQRGRLAPLSVFLETLVFFCHGLITVIYLPADWPALPASRLHAGIGAVPVVVGLAVVVAGMTEVGLRNAFGQSEGLRQTGLYRWTRNPQIVGYGLFVAGIAVLWPSWYALGWALLFVPLAHLMVLTEEEHLRNVFSEAYARYCEQVPRYLRFR